MSADIAEMNRIRDRLNAAPDAAALNLVADEERETVKRFAADAKTKPLAIIISNLKSYRLQVELPAKGKINK